MESKVEPFYYKPALEVRAFAVKEKFYRLLEEGLVDESNLRGRVLDIGVGYGGSYTVLRQFSDDVTGIEPQGEFAEGLICNGIVPADKLSRKSPLGYLESQHDGTFDFISGLLLSKEHYMQLQKLYKASLSKLKVGGQLLFTFDRSVMPKNYVISLTEILNEGDDKVLPSLLELKGFGQDDIALMATKSH
ncbi:class I SAM-dependent methyltransferase [Candidatus Woesearchaeota archaeon]|nr:class I SAM-dependent methyltransferase [Candidatus Woesearchaeota archaeon]